MSYLPSMDFGDYDEESTSLPKESPVEPLSTKEPELEANLSPTIEE